MIVLAGDIGGTNTRLALFDGDRLLHREAWHTADLDGLEGAVEALLRAAGVRPLAACFGVAGPVTGGFARLTNVGWSIDADRLAARFGFPACLVNDFHAQAAAVTAFGPEDVERLGGGAAVAGAPIALLGPGTGLGEAVIVPLAGGRYRILPTEGGHARFAPRDEREIGLLRFLWEQHPDHVSVERVLSGPGLVAIYDHLRGDAPRHRDMAREDPAAVVTRLALAGECAICAETLEIFVGVLGDEAANLALKTGARGGVFIGGGIAPRILGLLREGGLRAAFVDKGRFREWLEAIPLAVVTHPDAGLLGARLEALALAAAR
jgi:glucokinase